MRDIEERQPEWMMWLWSAQAQSPLPKKRRDG